MKKIFFTVLFITSTFFLFSQSSLSQETKNRLLERHNFYRQEQGAPNLIWSNELATEAQKWANVIAKKDQMVHSDMEYGENIYVASFVPTPERVVDLWASEQTFYNGEIISYQNNSLFGHYTQIIWSETMYVGCAEAVAKSGNRYWVCEYNPPGNFIGKKPVEKYKKTNE